MDESCGYSPERTTSDNQGGQGGLLESEEPDIPATIAVDAVCRRLGLDEDLVGWSTIVYAERKDLEWLKETADFGQLAKILYQDWKDIY